MVLAFTLVHCAAVGILLGKALVSRGLRGIEERRRERMGPQIRRLLMDPGAGGQPQPALRRLYRTNRGAVELCLAEFLQSLSGEGREQMTALAVGLGVVKRWKRQARSSLRSKRRRAIERLSLLGGDAGRKCLLRALEDSDEVIRIQAARALLLAGEAEGVEQVFEMAIRQPLFRVLLAPGLQGHAELLCREAIPKVLGSADPERMRLALRMMEGWGRVLPGLEVGSVVRHPDPEVRAAAVRLLPYTGRRENLPGEVQAALEEGPETVRAAAAAVAGRMKLAALTPLLAGCLRGSSSAVALAAAHALAGMGPQGRRLLSEAVLGGKHPGAGAALEALERAQTGAAELAGA